MALVEVVSSALEKEEREFEFDANGERLSPEEQAALREAEELADAFSDVKPDVFAISGNHLFQPPAEYVIGVAD